MFRRHNQNDHLPSKQMPQRLIRFAHVSEETSKVKQGHVWLMPGCRHGIHIGPWKDQNAH